jgi:Spy/CpxP family protein refolding chaperone
MKSLFVATALALGLAAAGVSAQPATGKTENHGVEFARHRAEFLADKLSLTDAQKLEVQAIFAEQAAAKREMHERFRTEREALRAQADAKLAAVLNAEQKAQLDALRAERKARWEDRRGGRRHHHTD